MEVIIEGFRCYSQKTSFKFTGGTTLVSGPSGIGKTTILQAIIFCLYGGRTNIYNRHENPNKSNCTVEIKLDGISIKRMKKPDRLSMLYNGSKYEDSEAQHIVHRMFGTYDAFMTCTYLDQEGSNYLFTCNETDKLGVLEEICFGDSRPSQEIIKIRDKITEYNSWCNSISVKHQSNVSQYTDRLRSYGLDESIINTVDWNGELGAVDKEISSLSNILDKLSKEITSLQTNQSKLSIDLSSKTKIRESMVASRNSKMKNISTLEATYNSERKLLDSMIEKYGNLYPNLTNLADVADEIFGLNNRLSSLTKQLEPDDDIILEEPTLPGTRPISLRRDEIDRLQIKTDRYKTRLEVLSGLDPRIAQMDQQQVRDLVSRIRDIEILEGQIDTLKKNPVESPNTNRSLTELRSRYQSLSKQLSNKFLSCPHCKAELMLSGEELVDLDKHAIEREVSKLKDLIVKSERHADFMSRMDDLDRSMKMSEYDMTLLKGSSVNEFVMSLNKLTFDDKPSLDIDDEKNKLSLAEEWDRKQEQYTKQVEIVRKKDRIRWISSSIDEISNLIADKQKQFVTDDGRAVLYSGVRGDIQRIATSDRLINEYTSMIDKSKKDLSDNDNKISTIESEISTCQSQLKTLKDKLTSLDSEMKDRKGLMDRLSNDRQRALNYIDLYTLYGECYNSQSELYSAQSRISKLNHLLTLSVETYYDMLQRQTDSISAISSEVCQRLFDQDVRIELSCFREVKSTHEVKPKIGLSVSYDSCQLTDVKSLSGGEKRRIYFALTLAFKIFCQRRILLLDESFNFMHSSLIEDCVEIIKEKTDDSDICIVVSHAENMGIYDDVLKMGK